MSALENFTGKFKHFFLTTWSIKNKTSIYLIMLIVSAIGVIQFTTLPKEQFPDIVIPTIYVSTIYTGNSPKDIENLVTRPIEKQIKAITGAKIKKFTSTSQQDYSAIVVEFETVGIYRGLRFHVAAVVGIKVNTIHVDDLVI